MFLENLVDSINQSYGFAENDPKTFQLRDLGPAGKNFSSTESRTYVEDGISGRGVPRTLGILMQQPDITVLVKKKQFSSLVENYRYDLLNQEEKLYIRAVKKLIHNKCKLLANYERLSKLDQIAANNGPISDYALPLIFSSVDVLNAAQPGLIDAKTMSTLNTIRQVKNFSDPSYVTTWLTDNSIPYLNDVGEGTGVFELTTVASLNVTNSVRFQGGYAQFTLEDPYKILSISNEDIEKALLQSSGFFTNPFFNTTKDQLQSVIEENKKQLIKLRQIRGAAEIKFVISPNSLLTKKVRAFIDLVGQEIIFTFDAGFLGLGAGVDLDQSAREGSQGLTFEEESIFKTVIQNIYVLLGLEESTQNSQKEFNKETNYVRSRMRSEFNGYSIIQPMDVVHIYISSKTRQDNQISQGFNINYAANAFLNKLDDAVGKLETNIEDMASAFSGGSGGQSFLEIEKNSIAGSEFPLWLWSLMRNDFTRQAAGTHVFAGLVDTAPHTFSGGKYTLSVTCKDNSSYFTFGQVNIRPSLDTFDSALYDPLTPFKLDFDASSGLVKGETPDLLDENIELLNSGAVRLKSGRFRGGQVDNESFGIMDGEGSETYPSNLFRRKFNDPDGFVYRWKQGIGSIVLFGSPHAPNFRKESAPSLTNDPFSGQDVMNVLSLLVTGQPYNFNNFLRAALNSASFSREDLFNVGGHASYFRGLLNDLSKNNSTWGNFIPFKKMVINESAYSFLRSGEFDLTTANRTATDLLRDRAKRFDELTSILPAFANNPQFYKQGLNDIVIDGDNVSNVALTASITKLVGDIIDLDQKIDDQTKSFQESLQNSNIRSTDGTLRIIGDDISFDPTVTGDTTITPEAQSKAKEEFRKKINYLTQRRLWKVKSNTDQNLFIVDDSYDKNYDIQAFERSLTNSLSTFKSTYAKVSDQIEAVSQMLGLEVFADSQGHIQARAPQYNRLPSSVLFKLLQDKQFKEIQIFPDFLEKLFFNQIQGLTDRIEILEDEVRLRAAALGFVTDAEIKSQLLNGAITGRGALATETNFIFVTSEENGSLPGTDLRKLLSQANPDLTAESVAKPLNQLSTLLKGVARTGVNFDLLKRNKIINQDSFRDAEDQINDRISTITIRLQNKTGNPPLTRQQLLPNDKNFFGSGRSQMDLLELSEQISQFLSERQYLIKILTNAVKNLDQGIALNKDSTSAQNALYPNLTTNTFPEILEHMIEDEDVDDFGEGSGHRFVLRDLDVISYTVEPTPPPFTIVEVDGSLENKLVAGPAGLEIGQGGNGISASLSVDYSLWRQYGFRGHQAVSVPFLSDPTSQCAPYGVFLLNQARKNILKAKISLNGNEYTQAGEVYYLEDRDLLFYAESVSHSFSYGQQFTTDINGVYGHSPGEFIPTILDIIGKGLYSTRHQANLARNIRNTYADGNTPITIVVNQNSTISQAGDPDSLAPSAGDALASLVSGSYGDQNRKNLTNLMLATSELITPTQVGNKLTLEVRVYFNSLQGASEANQDLMDIANSVKDWMANPSVEINDGNGNSLLPETHGDPILEESAISVVAVDLGEQAETRSPSSQALSIAKSLSLSQNIGAETGGVSEQFNNLYAKVIDFWAVFSSPETTVAETSDTTTDQLSQDQQDRKAKYLEDLGKKLNNQQSSNNDTNLFSSNGGQ